MRGGGNGGESKRYKSPVIKEVNYGDVMYSMVTTVKNTVLSI